MDPKDVSVLIQKEIDSFLADEKANTAGWNLLRERLFKFVLTLSVQDAFGGLILTCESIRYQHQLLAGELLLRAEIECTMPLREALVRIIPNFNDSADSVPKYFGKCFGPELVIDELKVIGRNMTNKERRTLSSIAYHLGERIEF
jgi:hypothetical protein